MHAGTVLLWGPVLSAVRQSQCILMISSCDSNELQQHVDKLEQARQYDDITVAAQCQALGMRQCLL